ncbi:MAG: hypothetical protein ACLP5V_00535 [Candidatus Bathyarchaeia archaeon]
MTATTQYYGSNSYGSYSPSNIQLTLPLSASCPNMGGQLWVVGNVYDTVANANLGSANSAINVNGDNYAGQLVFTLPPSVVEHQLQVSISIYSNYNYGQYGSVVGTASQTLTIHSNPSYSTPDYPYNGNYPPYYYPNYNQVGSCYNGQAIVYYNGAYYYASCYQYYQSYPYYHYYNPYQYHHHR